MLDFDTLNINLGLERTLAVLEKLENPHAKFKSIHVAGTNGKGSVCAMLAQILKDAGLKVGLFTSPHLFKWNERIKVDGDDIPDGNFKCQMTNVKLIAEELNLELTPFEIVTCAAFTYFAEQKIDIAVVEVGMGGRLDATNVITPIVSVITNIDFDHTEYLGNTLKEIATEKAGIIKAGVPVVTAERKEEPLKIIESICVMRDAQCLTVGDGDDARVVSGLGLRGKYQRENIAVVAKVVSVINDFSLAACILNLDSVQRTQWPGRFQIVSNDPLIIVDGAHNVAGARALKSSLEELHLGKPFTFVLGFQGYKDIKGILSILKSIAKDIIYAKSSHPQAAGDDKLGVKTLPIKDAIDASKKIGNPIVIAGSLFIVADALIYFKKKGMKAYESQKD